MIRVLQTGYYKHFKKVNNDGYEMVYYVHDLCEDTETSEIKVFYQAMYGDMKKYVRELNMFLSLVDTEKYPNTAQKYRFEKMSSLEVEKWKFHNPDILKEFKKQIEESYKPNKPIYNN